MIIIDTIDKYEKIYNYLLKLHFSNIELYNKTFHKYEHEFPEKIKKYINSIKYGSIYKNFKIMNPTCNILSIDEMNELYISFIGAKGSDEVFETPHVDGIFFYLPFCEVYRCIFAIQGNKSIVTEFPLLKKNCILDDNDYCAFDYNNEIHYIYQNEKKYNEKRILMKFHYIVCPKFIPLFIVEFYKILHVNYNNFMRKVFLKSQNKHSWLAIIVNNGTIFYIYYLSFIKFQLNIIKNIYIIINNFFKKSLSKYN